MKRIILVLLMVVSCFPALAQVGESLDRNGVPRPNSYAWPLPVSEEKVDGFDYLPAASATIVIGPHRPTRIYLPMDTYGVWINSFGGVTLMDYYDNLATGSFYRGVPIASGSGAPFDCLTGTTTPSIALISNSGASTTITLSSWKRGKQ